MNKIKSAPQQIKIIAGQWRGTNLKVLLKEGVRPTSNRIRETLFNWLQVSIEGSDCLDMFAGSGALGFEAVSRGASSAVIIDTDPAIIKLLTEQSQRLQANNIKTICADSLQYIEQTQNQFDTIFIDPPFAQYDLVEILNKISRSGILKDNTAIYVEAQVGNLPLNLPQSWLWKRQSKAGDVEYGLIET
ncbi:MAG: 16S rRNA (guanine(966)-N(2))-methyltransferase RsmD [Pseudomonadota bacterium]